MGIYTFEPYPKEINIIKYPDRLAEEFYYKGKKINNFKTIKNGRALYAIQENEGDEFKLVN